MDSIWLGGASHELQEIKLSRADLVCNQVLVLAEKEAAQLQLKSG